MMELKQQKNLVLSVYPFLDDEMIDACLVYVEQAIIASAATVNEGLVRDAFRYVSYQKVAAELPDLPSWQIIEICNRLADISASSNKNCFSDAEEIERIFTCISRLPTSSEDVNDILKDLCGLRNIEFIRTRLLQVIIYIRNEKKSLHSSKTTEGDNVVANIEDNLVDLLSACDKEVFYSIYAQLRELVSIAPKTSAFGVNINELRDNVAYYDENHPIDSPFGAIAEEIREAVHRRLSGDVIKLINELISFLESDTAEAFLSGRYCKATREEKDFELQSEIFAKLLDAREQLKLIWNDPFSQNMALSTSKENEEEKTAFLVSAVVLMKQLVQPFEDHLLPYDNADSFTQLHQTISALEQGRFTDMRLGPTRYSLNAAILNLAGAESAAKGRLLLNLMALDCVLENISLIYYSNIVNAELATVDDDNFDKALRTLPELVLCARATGQGTKAMRRLASSMKETIESNKKVRKVDAQAYVRETDEEILGFIYKLSQQINALLQASTRSWRFCGIDRVNNQILNDMIREKTTHLCGNLLSSIGRYLGGTSSEATRKLATSERYLKKEIVEKKVQLEDIVFRFGPDIERIFYGEENIWFMGGKGASETEISNLIVGRKLTGVDVPKGFGLCTQTWATVEGSDQKEAALEAIIRAEVALLEKRTGKRFGDPSNPLILIARSGAVVSMPGILPTVAHIGLNDEIVETWATTLKQPYRAYHAYLRFLFNYSEDVFRDQGLKREALFRGLETKRTAELCVEDTSTIKDTIKAVKQNIKVKSGGLTVPDDVYQQLFTSVRSNFSSYKSDLVVSHHKELRSIPAEYQSACLIQDCLPVLEDVDCSGIYLTRNPLNGGEGQIEYIYDFGEDLAGGRAKPGSNEAFRETYPAQHKELIHIGQILEEKYASPMDVEFAIRNDRLYMLQARTLTLAPMADVVTNYRIYQSGLMSETELIKRTRRIVGKPLINTFLTEIDKHRNTPIANGQPIAGGVVAGRIVSDVAEISKYPDEHIIFITKSNVPREIGLQSEIDGYISEEGGVTSHAALVSIGKLPCIVGVKWRKFGNRFFLGDTVDIKEGDVITLDANDGYIYRGKLPIQASSENDPEYLEAEKAILEIYGKAEEYTIVPAALY